MKYQFLINLALSALASASPLLQMRQSNSATCIPDNLTRGLSVTDDQTFTGDCIEANAQLGSGTSTIDPGDNTVVAEFGTCEIVLQNTIGTQSLTLQNFDLQGDAQVLLDPNCPNKLAFTVVTAGAEKFVLATFPAGSSNPQGQLPSDLSMVN
jgi:hypothetical protein